MNRMEENRKMNVRNLFYRNLYKFSIKSSPLTQNSQRLTKHMAQLHFTNSLKLRLLSWDTEVSSRTI
jgi:hypothetical protein